MTTELTEFAVTEFVTATIHMTALPNSEAFQGPLHIGFYPKTDETFLEFEGARINFPAHLVGIILKQIKRAHVMAKEQAE